MNNSEAESNILKQSISDFYLPDETQIRKLRKIINDEAGFKFTYQQAQEVSYQLLTLYEDLARGQHIIAGEPSRETRE